MKYMENSRMNNLEDQKQKIMQFIRMRGPNITMRVSNYLKVDSLITSAFLADLFSDKAVKMSSMKVGNSPVYFIPGQEAQLENFSQYISGKEREAFEILKREKVLQDDRQLPAIRVALRSIKDFAFSFEYGGNLYWRYLTFGENDAFNLINENRVNFSQLPQNYQRAVQPVNQIQKPVYQPEIVIEKKQEIASKIKGVEIIKPVVPPAIEEKIEVKPYVENPKIHNIFDKSEETRSLEKAPIEEDRKAESLIKATSKFKKSRIIKKSDFVLKVEEFLGRENIVIVNIIKKGKKEYMAVVSVDNDGEKNEYLCIAKEKKSVSDKELMKNLATGQKRNLPVLYISSGEASKKAVEWLDYLGNVIIYRKLE